MAIYQASELSYKLADAASRIKDDEMSVFLARLSDKLGHMHRSKYEPQPTRQEISIAKQIMAQTKQLAKAEQKEIVPDVVSEIEETVKDFGTDKSFETTESGDLELKKSDTDSSKVDKAYKGVMSYVGKDVNPKMRDPSCAPLVCACEKGSHGVIAKLIERGANVNMECLHICCLRPDLLDNESNNLYFGNVQFVLQHHFLNHLGEILTIFRCIWIEACARRNSWQLWSLWLCYFPYIRRQFP